MVMEGINSNVRTRSATKKSLTIKQDLWPVGRTSYMKREWELNRRTTSLIVPATVAAAVAVPTLPLKKTLLSNESLLPPLPPLYNCTPIRDMIIHIGRQDTLTDVCELYKKLDLDDKSIERIRERSISLISIVDKLASFKESNVCIISPGVYYISKSDSIIKFLFKISNIEHFLNELFFGLLVQEVKGTVPIQHVYPEAFCYEMPFIGLSLNYLLYDATDVVKRPFLHCIAKKHCQPYNHDETVYDLVSTCTQTLAEQLPYVIAEMINILTRLNNQKIVYLDIKPDNFAIDICTGQPYLIDMGLMTFAGTKYSDIDFDVDESNFYKYPQSPPELLRAEKCESKSMSYGMSYNLNYILSNLDYKGYNVEPLSKNSHFIKWLKNAKRENINLRPRMSELMNILKKCFTLSKIGNMTFEKALTMYSSL
uniref:Protein kinase n=2 Tax=root TaxID=1 RepID=A0A0C5FR42_PENJP|nr:protein kinase [Penaeus japonicus]GBG35410.1 wsv423-like protein [Marsupenaeus japonicus endogenous nimavirus]